MPFPEGTRLIRLHPGYNFKTFDCSNTDLNEFLINDAKNSMALLQSVTTILETDTEIVGFFSLLNDKISSVDLDSNTSWRKFFNLKNPKKKTGYPAMKIGRLAVSSGHQGKKIGETMLDFLKILFVTDNRTGCKFITIDAYNNPRTIKFYEKNDFRFLTKDDEKHDTRVMYFDLLPTVNSTIP
jgi:ribosomal protein S18 acetylase RimI-like enzyme